MEKASVKQALLAVCIMLASAVTLGAQGRGGIQEEIYIAYLKNEVYVQYGTPSIVEITNELGGHSNYRKAGTSYTGIWGAGYNRFLNPYFCIGAYFGTSESELKAKDSRTGNIVYTNNVRSYTGMVNFGWTYFRSGIWEISCGASAGIANKNENITQIGKGDSSIPKESDKTVFAYNFTVAKVRIGGGIIGGFAEFGFGYRGIANAGLSVRF